MVASIAVGISALVAAPTAAAAAVTGQGFTVTPSDLAFILDQIKIAERHSAALAADAPLHAGGPCVGLVGPAPDQVPNILTSYGLRTVDGSCNNLVAGRDGFGAADRNFPRLTTPDFAVAEADPGLFGPPGGPATSYAQTSGNVFDAEPRVVSNLVVDQTSTNPAAVQAAGFPVRTQGNTGVFPCTSPGVPVGCVPAGETLFIPNVTTDVGLSPPFNSLFTIFGQFFDHGVDKIANGGAGTVFVPLKADDPLVAGPDKAFGTADDLPANLRFMALTRSTVQPGPSGHEAENTDSPWVDLSQNYTSHPAHQVYLREYAPGTDGRPHDTGRFLGMPDGTMANWARVKAEVAAKLGLRLGDADVFDIPVVLTDPYGNFTPGPLRGLPQFVTTTGLVEGNLASPVAVPANVARVGAAFLDDIGRSARPTRDTLGNLLPDADTVAGRQLETPVPAGTYDNELLDLHVIAGDGRVNENVALTAIHTVFEREHNRLVGDLKNVLLNDTSATGVAALAEWRQAVSADGWNGQRLFQAARFITEMEYQHLVFEEFARKVQPLIDPFTVYSPDVDPATTAEFAHAVYRFGHSMLDDTIPMIDAAGNVSEVQLFDAFLNPALFSERLTAADLAASGGDRGAAGAGAIIMGLSDQVGNEIDEFVAETLRNRLLGLPLDLPTLNMARARAEGIPRLNEVRRQINAATNDAALAPYTSWLTFGQQLKHPESLVNFVAAYGRHPSITGAATQAARRTAAQLIVDPPIGTPFASIPADAFDFMNASGTWATTETGINLVDLWIGGLAERTNLFGGLLGSTFNYVFETQLTNLQNNDRFYYLARTPGMNLRAQLEGNSFAELVMRNTTATNLKADAFATADCKFQLGSNPGIATPTGTNAVVDDPASECNESALLLREPNGTIRYRTTNSVDPPGINGQSVFNGTAGVDRIWGGVDNDTFWGGPGNDIIEGNDGADIALGGDGNDIITDLAGDDVPKGGPGNDAIDAGPGLDIIMGGDGADFTNGGLNDNETFLGNGDDFAIAGNGIDAVFGGSGDDWIEGGNGQDLLIGESGAPFFDDPDRPGHDVLVGQPGENDYDAEGGDDILMSYPAVERNAGAAGWDWVSGQYDTVAMDVDLNLTLAGLPLPIVVTRDRYQEVEAVSGSAFNDRIVGDSIVPSAVGGIGFTGCDALDQAGINRISGLSAIVPALAAGNLGVVTTASVTAATQSRNCPLTGAFVWGGGNILLGGAGNDTFTGNGGDDIIDGNRRVNARISVRNTAGTEIGSTDLMESPARTGTFGPGTTAMTTLQQAVFAGLVDPGNLRIVREVLVAPVVVGEIDTAVFTGQLANYTITNNPNGSITVVDTTGVDGTDTLWNIERLQFPGALATDPPIVLSPTATNTTTPVSLAFAGRAVNTTSPAQLVTVRNSGATPLTVTGATVTGPNAAEFARTNGCTTVLAPNATCTVSVTFRPTANGARSATLTITSNGGTTTVALTGAGVATPTITVTPTALTFTSQALNTTSPAQVVTVRNTGTGPLTVSSAVVSGPNLAEFTVTNGCTVAVAVNATCTVSVAFRPTASGSRTATLTLTSNASNGPTTTIALAGTGARLVNGSFETPALPNGGSQTNGTGTSWTFTNAVLARNGNVLFSGAPVAPDGQQAVVLRNSNSRISQSLTVRPGDTVTFRAAQGRQGILPSTQQIGVFVDGVLRSTVTPPSGSFGTFTVPLNVTTAGAHTVEFRGMVAGIILTIPTALIDAVAVLP